MHFLSLKILFPSHKIYVVTSDILNRQKTRLVKNLNRVPYEKKFYLELCCHNTTSFFCELGSCKKGDGKKVPLLVTLTTL